MNREELFAAMNGIKDEYIAEADPTIKAAVPLYRKLRPILTMAAAMVIVVGIVSMAGNLFGPKGMAPAMDQTECAVTTAEEGAVEEAAPLEPAAGETGIGAVAESIEEAAPAEEPAEMEIEEALPATDSEEATAEMDVADQKQQAAENRTITMQEIFLDGVCYEFTLICDAQPENLQEIGILSSDPAATCYTPYTHNGETVWASEEEPNVLFVESADGWLRYEKSE